MLTYPFLAEDVRALESVWVIGDQLINKTVRHHFNSMTAPFIAKNFDVQVVAGGEGSEVSNIFARLVNSFINTYNREKRLPKWILLLPDDDVIKKPTV